MSDKLSNEVLLRNGFVVEKGKNFGNPFLVLDEEKGTELLSNGSGEHLFFGKESIKCESEEQLQGLITKYRS